jgi:two-component system sensor histidine kinase KdpD
VWRAPLNRALQCAASAALSVFVVIAATYPRHVNHTTVALALVLLIMGLSMRWGWREGLAASLAGGLGFDYFFLPPRGFNPESPEQLVTLCAFLLTAVTTGQLSALAGRNRSEAERRRDEMEGLYRFGNALLDCESAESALDGIADKVAGIFGASGVAFFNQDGGRIFRSGPEANGIEEYRLREVAGTGNPFFGRSPAASVVPVWRNGTPAGSLGIAGTFLSRSMLEAVSERVGVALARAGAAQESMAAELARRSEDLKSAVLDALAHEIKAPLATVKVSVTTLLSPQPGNPAQQRELLNIIDEESDRMARLTDDAIQVSRREAGQLRLKKTANSVNEVVAHALVGLGPLAAGRQIRVNIPESLPIATFDVELIEKVIRLVVDNALKYSPPESPVEVTAEFTGAEIVLSVEDHGRGIPENERERVFESNYRGSASRGVPGTGLGLASARCIMEAHAGEIWVTGAAGTGSVFHISLPATGDVADERSDSVERR